jgi:hypothetical protein
VDPVLGVPTTMHNNNFIEIQVDQLSKNIKFYRTKNLTRKTQTKAIQITSVRDHRLTGYPPQEIPQKILRLLKTPPRTQLPRKEP